MKKIIMTGILKGKSKKTILDDAELQRIKAIDFALRQINKVSNVSASETPKQKRLYRGNAIDRQCLN